MASCWLLSALDPLARREDQLPVVCDPVGREQPRERAVREVDRPARPRALRVRAERQPRAEVRRAADEPGGEALHAQEAARVRPKRREHLAIRGGLEMQAEGSGFVPIPTSASMGPAGLVVR